MLTEKDYCDYDTCVALKKLGYKEKTLAYYTSEGIFNWRRAYIYDVAIPDLAKSSNSNKELRKHVLDAVSLYEAQKWLREEKDVFIEVIHTNLLGKDYFNVHLSNTDCAFESIFGKSSYEEALSEGIKGAVKILKDK